jgi:hypothetical protein
MWFTGGCLISGSCNTSGERDLLDSEKKIQAVCDVQEAALSLAVAPPLVRETCLTLRKKSKRYLMYRRRPYLWQLHQLWWERLAGLWEKNSSGMWCTGGGHVFGSCTTTGKTYFPDSEKKIQAVCDVQEEMYNELNVCAFVWLLVCAAYMTGPDQTNQEHISFSKVGRAGNNLADLPN